MELPMAHAPSIFELPELSTDDHSISSAQHVPYNGVFSRFDYHTTCFDRFIEVGEKTSSTIVSCEGSVFGSTVQLLCRLVLLVSVAGGEQPSA